VKNIGWIAIVVAVLAAPGQVNAHRHVTRQVSGLDVPAAQILRDLRRLVGCKKDVDGICYISPSEYSYTVRTDKNNGRVGEVELQLMYSDGLNHPVRDKKSAPILIGLSKYLVHYFMPNWDRSSNWTKAAINKSINEYCRVSTRHDGMTIAVYPDHPADLPELYLYIVIFRGRSPERFTLPRGDAEDCIVNTDNP
jgi:hypothetical protein